MKKIFLSLTLALTLFLASAAFAADVSIPGLNLQGDTVYLPRTGAFGVGVGTTLASAFDGLIEVRGEFVSPVTEGDSSLLGAGVGLNIPRLVEALGGTWVLKGITSSVGVLGLVDVKARPRFEPGLYVTVLRVQL